MHNNSGEGSGRGCPPCGNARTVSIFGDRRSFISGLAGLAALGCSSARRFISAFAPTPPAAFGNYTHTLGITGRLALKEKLAHLIRTSPDTLQFAKDRKYEEAWIIRQSVTRPSAAEYKAYLDETKFDVLIVEYVWNSEDDDKRFVLTLFQDGKCKLQNSAEFMRICVDLFYKKVDFTNLINTLDQKVIGREYLFTNSVDSVSMGVFNHWFSVGPVDLWKKGDPYNEDVIKERLKSKPEVEKERPELSRPIFQI
jgi:hypothetical protein